MRGKKWMLTILLCCLSTLLLIGCGKEKDSKQENKTLETDGEVITSIPDLTKQAEEVTKNTPQPTKEGNKKDTKELENQENENQGKDNQKNNNQESNNQESNNSEKGSQKEDDLAEKTQEELIKLAEDYAQDLAKGHFTDVADQFSEEVKAQIDAENLKTIWESGVLLYGNYKKIEKDLTKFAKTDKTATVGVVLRYETNGILVTITFNPSLQISALWFNPYSFEAEELNQKPTPVPDKREEEIKLGSGEYVLDGILTIPDGVKNPPVVILVQGSGQSDMDETIGSAGNKPFRDIARGLADKGIASIRYNKRYYQYPDLADKKITIAEEVLDDVTQAIQYAASRTELDKNKIYVLGHSLGGMLAPKIAADNKEVAGIISLAGTARGLEEVIYDQNINALEKMNTLSEEEKQAQKEQLEIMINQVKNITEENLLEPMLGGTGYYWRSLNEIDTPFIVKQLTIPMLFLQGSADFQIYTEVDFKLWKELLSDRENVFFRLYDGLNHLFMKTNGLQGTEEYDIAGNVESKVISDIADFIMTGKLLEEK